MAKTVVTTTMARRMRKMREEGRSWMEIAVENQVSLTTAMRHGSDHHAQKQRELERARYYRNKSKEKP